MLMRDPTRQKGLDIRTRKATINHTPAQRKMSTMMERLMNVFVKVEFDIVDLHMTAVTDQSRRSQQTMIGGRDSKQRKAHNFDALLTAKPVDTESVHTHALKRPEKLVSYCPFRSHFSHLPLCPHRTVHLYVGGVKHDTHGSAEGLRRKVVAERSTDNTVVAWRSRRISLCVSSQISSFLSSSS